MAQYRWSAVVMCAVMVLGAVVATGPPANRDVPAVEVIHDVASHPEAGILRQQLATFSKA